MLKSARDFFRDSVEQRALQHSLQLVDSDVLVQHALPDYHVFLMDARWTSVCRRVVGVS